MKKDNLLQITVERDGERKTMPLAVPCETGEVSDGYHTFNELYAHRYALFCALAKMSRLDSDRLYCWKSAKHWIEDKLESVWDGWFLAGIEIDGQMITYHLPLEYWGFFDGIERKTPPPHDGHTSQDVLDRLMVWLHK